MAPRSTIHASSSQRGRPTSLTLCVVSLLTACTSPNPFYGHDSRAAPEAGSRDGATAPATDVTAPDRLDQEGPADLVPMDAPADAGTPADAQGDAEPDAPGDAEPDAQGDAEPDAPGDAEPDAPGDAEPDAQGDAEPDAPGDAEPDAPGDAEPDAPGDADPDASICGDGVCEAGESCDGQEGTLACPADCPGKDWPPNKRFCCVEGVCVGVACPAPDCP